MALVQLGMGKALLVCVGNFIVGFIVGNVIEPHLIGRKLGLSKPLSKMAKEKR
jgi:predicted PurR-regulated permease PerM